MFLLGFVIMPEHFHLLTVPAENVKVAWIMQEIKKGSARLVNKDRRCRAQGRARLPAGILGRPGPRGNMVNGYPGPMLVPDKVWMDEYYDCIIRGEKDLVKHLAYIHNNPVKRGLVESAEEYLWSSAHPTFENDLEKLISGSATSPIT